MQLFLLRPRATAAGLVRVRLTCPARWPGGPARRCQGRAKFEGAAARRNYDIAPGGSLAAGFRLARGRRGTLRRRGALTLQLDADNADSLGGTASYDKLRVRRPLIAPKVRLLTRRLRLRRGRVRVRVACPRRGDVVCRGRLTLRTPRGRRLGTRTFRLRLGRRRTLQHACQPPCRRTVAAIGQDHRARRLHEHRPPPRPLPLRRSCARRLLAGERLALVRAQLVEQAFRRCSRSSCGKARWAGHATGPTSPSARPGPRSPH